MSKELLRVVVSLGMVDDSQLDEFIRWGFVDRRMLLDKPKVEHGEAVQRLNLAMDMVGIDKRETDLDIPRAYMNTRATGHVYANVDDNKWPPVSVYYGKTCYGGYIFPCNAPGFEEVLTNGKTYLETDTHKVYLMDPRPVYFDELQSYVVCKPGVEEARDGDGQ